VALRGGRRHVARLAARDTPTATTLGLDGAASFIVTGGYGGLGPKIACWLADQGARRIVLVGRRGPPTDAGRDALEAALEPLRGRGVEIVAERADVADAAAMTALFERQAAAGRPVRGVVHAAASIRFQSLQTLSQADLEEALRAKVQGAWVLHELTRELVADRALQLFVLFSSATTLFGAKGLAAYASANQFLGALARHRAVQGLAATCVDWGAWSEIRLLGPDHQADITRLGYRPMPDEKAFGVLAGLVQARVPSCMVADMDWPTALAAYQVQGRRPFLDGMAGAVEGDAEAAPVRSAVAAQRAAAGAADEPREDLRASLAALAPRERRERMVTLVRQELARVLGLAGPLAVDPAKGFFELGLDSLMAMQLRRGLGERIGLKLSATVTFNHPSVLPLAEHLLALLDLADTEPQPATDTGAPAAAAPDAIAELSDDEVRRALMAELQAAGLEDDEEAALATAGAARRPR
jgi:myxalamid-type polyketide synthase MxaE and MxaD